MIRELQQQGRRKRRWGVDRNAEVLTKGDLVEVAPGSTDGKTWFGTFHSAEWGDHGQILITVYGGYGFSQPRWRAGTDQIGAVQYRTVDVDRVTLAGRAEK